MTRLLTLISSRRWTLVALALLALLTLTVVAPPAIS
jgi:hypothetical protein